VVQGGAAPAKSSLEQGSSQPASGCFGRRYDLGIASGMNASVGSRGHSVFILSGWYKMPMVRHFLG